jgi:hypothetical protein
VRAAQVSIHTCEVVAHALLARVPLAGARLARALAPGGAEGPTLPVRTMRRGLNLAYGSAGALTGVGLGMLHVSRALLQRRQPPAALQAGQLHTPSQAIVLAPHGAAPA